MTPKSLSFNFTSQIKNYFELTKPGIVMGNLMTASAGLALALSSQTLQWSLFLSVLIGLFCVIGSACAFNNVIDREYDAKMVRTQKRALVTQLISPKEAMVFATLLGLIGFSIFVTWVGMLATLLTLFAYFTYIVFYSFLKHQNNWATLVGSLAGAAPPAIGYLALSKQFDLNAVLLFSALVCWQMPHFYAIAIFRMKDYANASIPILPLVKGFQRTQISMLLYVFAFWINCLLFYTFKQVQFGFLISSTMSCLPWLFLSIKGFKEKNKELWARKMFFYSLWVILFFSFGLIFFRV